MSEQAYEFGIDVSRFQGTINWPRVAASGVEFAIIRAGFGRLTSQEDPYFARNYTGATAAGLPVGCYWYSYATTTAGAEAEAEACLQVIAPRTMELGVWFDQEYEPGILALTNAQRTAIIQAFLARIRAAGYTAGLYCSADWIENRVNTEEFDGENLWIAQYGPQLTVSVPVNIWQYSSTGMVSGITGNVDLDRMYRRPSENASSPMPPLGTATLRLGSRGVYVSNLQSILDELGYDPGTIDGIFGRNTENAVRAFQRAAGLIADGKVGPITRAALDLAWKLR